jgi:eukaryotic-like serine/threonine-protein kinase
MRSAETLKEPLYVQNPKANPAMETTDPVGAPLPPDLDGTEPLVGTVADPDAQKPGGAVGRYTLTQRIAASGWSEHWKAERAGAATQVVLKRVLPLVSKDAPLVESFLADARAVMPLRHPNIVRVIEATQADGDVFMVSELVDGHSLEIVLRRAARKGFLHLPPPVAGLIGSELLAGLEHAHQQNVLHGELRPEHVLIGFDGRTRLFGFGAARYANHRVTPLMPIPMWHYFAPEQIEKRTIDARSDTFVAGMILFRMLCGQFPFPGRPEEVRPAILEGRFPTPVAVNPQLSMELSELLSRALQPKAALRFATAAELEAALRKEAARSGPPVTVETLAAFMAWLFEEDFQKKGVRIPVSDEQRTTFEFWARSTQPVSMDGDTAKAMEARTATEPVPPEKKSNLPWFLALGVGAALIAGLLFWALR